MGGLIVIFEQIKFGLQGKRFNEFCNSYILRLLVFLAGIVQLICLPYSSSFFHSLDCVSGLFLLCFIKRLLRQYDIINSDLLCVDAFMHFQPNCVRDVIFHSLWSDFLHFKEFELYWGAVFFFKICSHIFMIFEVKLEQ